MMIIGQYTQEDFVIVLKEIGFKVVSKGNGQAIRKFGLGEESDRIDYKEFLKGFLQLGWKKCVRI